MSNLLLINDQSFLQSLFRIDDGEQRNDPTNSASPSKRNNADLDQLICVNSVNYLREIYINNFLSTYDACEIIIEFL